MIGYKGRFVYDAERPDGTPRKLLDVGRLHQLGWRAQTPLREGLEKTYRWLKETPHARGRTATQAA